MTQDVAETADKVQLDNASFNLVIPTLPFARWARFSPPPNPGEFLPEEGTSRAQDEPIASALRASVLENWYSLASLSVKETDKILSGY
jgi:hypothetical protein